MATSSNVIMQLLTLSTAALVVMTTVSSLMVVARAQSCTDTITVELPNTLVNDVVEECKAITNTPGQCPVEFPAMKTTASDYTAPLSCPVSIIGAGTGGAYVAMRLIDTKTVPASDICVFEATSRVGGRLYSLRGLGKNGDLSVDAGGYRTWPRFTPVTHALITEVLGLGVECYEDEDPCEKFNIIDKDGNKAGFATMPEEMMRRVTDAGVRYFPTHKLVSMTKVESSTHLHFENGIKAAAGRVFLNIPQRPLLEVLRGSESLLTPEQAKEAYSGAHAVQTEMVAKVYLYYPNAWWYDLGLTNGEFADEGDATNMPLKGRYHDGHVKCADPVKRTGCDGFLLSTYIHDYAGETSMYFRRFQEERPEPVTIVSNNTAEGRIFLEHAHKRLMDYHSALPAGTISLPQYEINKKLSRARAPPEFAVLATWNNATVGSGGGWHGWTDLDRVNTAKFPFPESLNIDVINEAFSNVQGWAEGSLQHADAVLKLRYGIESPWNFTVTEGRQIVAQTQSKKCEEESVGPVLGGGGGSDDEHLCFLGETRIAMHGDEAPRRLDEMKVGDVIRAGDDTDATSVVTEVLVHPVGRTVDVAVLTGGAKDVVASLTHPIKVGGAWLESRTAIEQGLIAGRIEKRFVAQYYNLEVDGHAPGASASEHSYILADLNDGVRASGLGDDVTLNRMYRRQVAWGADSGKMKTTTAIGVAARGVAAAATLATSTQVCHATATAK